MMTARNENKRRSCCDELAASLSPGFFKALADPNRVAILVHIAESGKEQTVTDVSCCCPIDISVVSRHLGVLRDAGVLEAKKRGREVFYSVRVDKLTTLLRNLADALEACCSEESCIEGRKKDDPEQKT
ncbi:MAG: ArsR/SmtB family transcription factor [Acidobacteriota bacterium]